MPMSGNLICTVFEIVSNYFFLLSTGLGIHTFVYRKEARAHLRLAVLEERIENAIGEEKLEATQIVL